jgi:hypothetical protein
VYGGLRVLLDRQIDRLSPLEVRLLYGLAVAREPVDVAAEQHLLALLAGWREVAEGAQGYGPGNVVNALRLLRGHLRGLDLSRLVIRQAHLHDIEAQDSSFAGSCLTDCVLAAPFDHPLVVALSAGGASLAVGTVGGALWLWQMADRTPLLTGQGPNGLLTGVALSADGRLLASCSHDGTIRWWDVQTGAGTTLTRTHAGGVRAVALSGDGHLLVSSGGDETVRLWDTRMGACTRTLRPDRRYERMGITGLMGVTEAQRATLVMLGALDRAPAPDHPRA